MILVRNVFQTVILRMFVVFTSTYIKRLVLSQHILKTRRAGRSSLVKKEGGKERWNVPVAVTTHQNMDAATLDRRRHNFQHHPKLHYITAQSSASPPQLLSHHICVLLQDRGL